MELFVKLFEADKDHTPLVYHPFFQDLYLVVGSFDTFKSNSRYVYPPIRTAPPNISYVLSLLLEVDDGPYKSLSGFQKTVS